MQVIKKSEKIRFSALQATYWCSIAALSSFAVALATDRGVSPATIGIMAAVFKAAAVIGQFFWGAVCDKLRSNRKVFIVMNILMFAVTMGFYYFKNVWMMTVFYALMGFMNSPTSSNLDTWIMAHLKKGNDNSYGIIRSMGSLGYAVFVFFYGSLVASKGYWVMPIFMLCFVLMTVVISISMPNDREDDRLRGAKTKINPSDFKALLTNTTFVFLMVILFFDGFAIMSIGQMKALIFTSMGADPNANIGYDGFVAGLAQVPMMFLAAKLTKFSPMARLAAGITLDMAMIAIDFCAVVPQMIFIGSIMSGLGYGLILPAMRELIASSTDDKLRTSAQGIGDAAYISVSGILGSLASGYLIDAFGMKFMLGFFMCVQIIPIVATIVFIAKTSKKKNA
ncbi:MAG: MFS transporter [Clostridia bacterium]|nr:MFS transporter [Clostridia bacterium]